MTTVTDDFNRSDADNISTGAPTAWTEVRGDWDISSNALTLASITGFGEARADTDLAGDDNYAEVVAVNATFTTSSYGPACRWQSGAETFYAFLWRNSTNTYTLFRCVTGSFTVLANATTTGRANGDVLRIEAEGTTIRGFKNGVQIATTTDANIGTGTRGGIVSSAAGHNFDDFEMGDLGGGGGGFQSAWTRGANVIIQPGR